MLFYLLLVTDDGVELLDIRLLLLRYADDVGETAAEPFFQPQIVPANFSGEGAFYGPKLEFILRDAIGREWQCGTIQVDMNLPQRFDISYIGEDGEKHQPVMLHRALFGSIERFLGILIENHAGKLPLWLSPEQVVVAPIVSEFDEYAQEVTNKLRMAGLTAKADLRNEKINYKVREHSLAKIPVIAVVGAKEKENGTVTVRRLGSEKQTVMKLDDFIKSLVEEAQMPHINE